MLDVGKRLFVGIKISKALQSELNNPAPGTEHYFKSEDVDYLQIISSGDDKLIGKYVQDGFPVSGIDIIGRNLCSVVKLITRGHRVEEDSVHIYIP
jgi:hypothetical protein